MNNGNLAILDGRLGKEPTITPFAKGGGAVTFSLACSDDYFDKTKNEYVPKTDWVSVKIFASDLEKYITWGVGDTIQCIGKSTTESWENKETKKKEYKQLVICNTAKRKRISKQGDSKTLTIDDIAFM
jgi:single-stranded DNA-binding protein